MQEVRDIMYEQDPTSWKSCLFATVSGLGDERFSRFLQLRELAGFDHPKKSPPEVTSLLLDAKQAKQAKKLDAGLGLTAKLRPK